MDFLNPFAYKCAEFATNIPDRHEYLISKQYRIDDKLIPNPNPDLLHHFNGLLEDFIVDVENNDEDACNEVLSEIEIATVNENVDFSNVILSSNICEILFNFISQNHEPCQRNAFLCLAGFFYLENDDIIRYFVQKGIIDILVDHCVCDDPAMPAALMCLANIIQQTTLQQLARIQLNALTSCTGYEFYTSFLFFYASCIRQFSILPSFDDFVVFLAESPDSRTELTHEKVRCFCIVLSEIVSFNQVSLESLINASVFTNLAQMINETDIAIVLFVYHKSINCLKKVTRSDQLTKKLLEDLSIGQLLPIVRSEWDDQNVPIMTFQILTEKIILNPTIIDKSVSFHEFLKFSLDQLDHGFSHVKQAAFGFIWNVMKRAVSAIQYLRDNCFIEILMSVFEWDDEFYETRSLRMIEMMINYAIEHEEVDCLEKHFYAASLREKLHEILEKEEKSEKVLSLANAILHFTDPESEEV